MKKGKRVLLLVLFLFLAVNVAMAAQAPVSQRLLGSTQTKPAGNTDLSFTPWPVPPMLEQPTEGDPLNYHQINFSLTNASNVASAATTVRVTCESLDGTSCPTGLSGVINFSALAPHTGQGTSWPTEAMQTWPQGNFKLTFVIDPNNKITEINKSNNSFSQTIQVKKKTAGLIQGLNETGTGVNTEIPNAQDIGKETWLNPQPEPPIYDPQASGQKLQKK